jgi:hypothetical protein
LKTATLALVLVLTGAAPALAQTQDDNSAAARGQVNLTYNSSRPAPAPADKTALQAKGVKLRDMILATPALADPHGFALSVSLVLERPTVSRSGDPDMVWGNVILRFINVARGKPDAAGRYPGDGEGPFLRYSFNKLGLAFVPHEDALTGYYALPAGAQERDGVMTFSRSGYDYMLVTRPGVSAYQAVSIGEYLPWKTARLDKEGSTPEAAGARAALAALSPAERAAPFCVTNTGSFQDVRNACRHPSAKPLVTLNPALNAGTGAASKPRFLVLFTSQPPRKGPDNLQLLPLRKALGQLDRATLQALLN